MKQTIIAVSGIKNAGKTTLIEGVLPLLAEKGFRVAVIKHHGHRNGFDPDVPGKDTYRFFHAGAIGTAIVSNSRFMLVKEQRVSTDSLIDQLPEADIVLLEGFLTSNYPKIVILGDEGRESKLAIAANPKSNTPQGGNLRDSRCAFKPETVIAYVGGNKPDFHRDDIAGIANFMIRFHLSDSDVTE